MVALLVLIVIIAAAAFYFVGIYNKLVTLRNRFRNAFGAVTLSAAAPCPGA